MNTRSLTDEVTGNIAYTPDKKNILITDRAPEAPLREFHDMIMDVVGRNLYSQRKPNRGQKYITLVDG